MSENKRKTVMLVTGSTDGIGQETALQLAHQDRDRHIIIHGRSQAKLTKTQQMIIDKTGNGNIHTIMADFAVLDQVQTMAENLKKDYTHIDVVVANAGVLLPDRQETADGFEMTMQVNHIAHFLLINSILPLLQASPSARIVHVSSMCHTWEDMDWKDMQAESNYTKYAQYSRTKLCNVLFSNELSRRLNRLNNTDDDDQDRRTITITSNALEPGVIQTKLLAAGGYSGAPVATGAVASVRLASDPDLEGVTGQYFDNHGQLSECCAAAKSTDDALKLWLLTQEWCGIDNTDI